MLLSARMLNDVAGVNSYEMVQDVAWTQGDTIDVYLQLIDASLDKAEAGFYPSGRRYMPAASSSLVVSINSIDSTKTYAKTATQPFSQDPSIWKISIASTDQIVGSRDLLLTLTEGSKVTKGRVKSAISVHSQSESF